MANPLAFHITQGQLPSIIMHSRVDKDKKQQQSSTNLKKNAPELWGETTTISVIQSPGWTTCFKAHTSAVFGISFEDLTATTMFLGASRPLSVFPCFGCWLVLISAPRTDQETFTTKPWLPYPAKTTRPTCLKANRRRRRRQKQDNKAGKWFPYTLLQRDGWGNVDIKHLNAQLFLLVAFKEITNKQTKKERRFWPAQMKWNATTPTRSKKDNFSPFFFTSSL